MGAFRLFGRSVIHLVGGKNGLKMKVTTFLMLVDLKTNLKAGQAVQCADRAYVVCAIRKGGKLKIR